MGGDVKTASQFIRITAKDNTLSIIATNLQCELKVCAVAKIDEEFDVMTCYKEICSLVNNFPKKSVVFLKHVYNTLQVSHLSDEKDTTNRSIYAPRVDSIFNFDIPKADHNTAHNNFQLAVCDLRILLDKTRFSISLDKVCNYLHGLLLEIKQTQGGDVLRAVSSDGHRLTMAEIEAKLNFTIDNLIIDKVFLPKPTVDALAKAVVKLNKEDIINVDILRREEQTYIVFSNKNGDFCLSSELEESKFPDYESFIPKDNNEEITVNSESLSSAVEKMKIYSKTGINSVAEIDLYIKDGVIKISTEGCEGSTQLDATMSTTVDLKIRFNAKYLLDVCNRIDSQLKIYVKNGEYNDCILFLIKNCDNNSELYMIAPMRV